jgi:hypothetical protein
MSEAVESVAVSCSRSVEYISSPGAKSVKLFLNASQSTFSLLVRMALLWDRSTGEVEGKACQKLSGMHELSETAASASPLRMKRHK